MRKGTNANGSNQENIHLNSNNHVQNDNIRQGGLHRRGMSLDETRVKSGLIGVAPQSSVASRQLPLVPSATALANSKALGDQSAAVSIRNQTDPSAKNSLHRRVFSSSNFYPPQAGNNRFPSFPEKQQQPHIQYLQSSNTQQVNNNNPLRTPELNFVNSTVEALEDQIRKEDAPKKKRTRTTPEQLRILQKAFNADPMPNSNTRVALAKKLGMNARAVQVWFQNRRAKAKMEAKRAESGGASGTGSGRGSGSTSPYPQDYHLNGSGNANQDDDYYYDDDGEGEEEEDGDEPPRSLKPNSGFLHRMAFPSDFHDPYNHRMYTGATSLNRSYSLPFNVTNTLTGHHDFLDGMGGDGMLSPVDGTLLLDGDGMAHPILPRSDSVQFAPYEFAGGEDVSTRGFSSRCQSLPVEQFGLDDAAIDLLPTINETMWPIADPYVCGGGVKYQDPSVTSLHQQPSNMHMRRSFSLPNVHQPDFIPLYAEEEGEEDGASMLTSRHDHHVDDPMGVDEDDYTVNEMESLDLMSPIMRNYDGGPGHRRSRSHSISIDDNNFIDF